MRVAIVYPLEFGARGYYGGGERYAYKLAQALAERVECRLVVVGARGSTRFEGRLRVDTHSGLPVGQQFNSIAPGLISTIARVDVVHCICYGTLVADLAILVSRALRKRVFITDVGGRGPWSLTRYGDIYRLASGMLPLSEFSSGTFPGTRPPRKVIYGGVDTQMFAPGEAPRQQVLYVGRLLPHKGIDYLINAVRPEWSTTILGRPYNATYLHTLKQLARGKNVRFCLTASDKDVAAEMRTAAVAVHPSVHTDSQGSSYPLTELLGLSVLEEMASETPVVCTNVASLPEIVENGVTGLLVPPNDSTALCHAIDRILSDQASAREMGMAARRRVLNQFTWDHVAETCLRAYRELV